MGRLALRSRGAIAQAQEASRAAALLQVRVSPTTRPRQLVAHQVSILLAGAPTPRQLAVAMVNIVARLTTQSALTTTRAAALLMPLQTARRAWCPQSGSRPLARLTSRKSS